MAKAHGGKSGKDGARPPNPAGAVTVRESFRASQAPKMRQVAFSAKEIEASIEAVKGPPLEGRPPPARALSNLVSDERVREDIALGHINVAEFWLQRYLVEAQSKEQVDSATTQLEAHLAFVRGDTTRRAEDIFADLTRYVAELRTSGRIPPQSADRFTRVIDLLARNLLDATKISATDLSEPPPLYTDRTRNSVTFKRPTALEWFDLHWKPRVDAGLATGDDISQHDPRFYNTLSVALRRQGKRLSDVLPPSPTRGRRAATEEERLTKRRARGVVNAQRWRDAKRQPS